MGLDWSAPTVSGGWLWANAFGHRRSKCVTAAPWKSPMMAWTTVCGDYFRVAEHPEVGQSTQASMILFSI